MLLVHAWLAAIALAAPEPTVLYDFYADWCGPCRAMESTVAELAAKGYPVQKVNVDQNPALAAQYGVTSIPCFVMVAQGREIDRVVGGTNLARLEAMFQAARAATAPAADSTLASASSPRRGASGPGQAGPGGSPPTPYPDRAVGATGPADQRILAATVRLRIRDATGQSCGSGTIIDARGGEALVLTCGHIFRDSQGKGAIEVDLFGPGAERSLPGVLVSYDLESDVGLVAIRPPGPVTTARVAPADYRLKPGQPVVTAGCNHGAEPTLVHSRITTIDRYQGPPNLQVAGQSIEGRSGGGVFTTDGWVVGVCNAAEPVDDEAFCAAIGAIHRHLDRNRLAFVYQGGEPPCAPVLAAVPGGGAPANSSGVSVPAATPGGTRGWSRGSVASGAASDGDRPLGRALGAMVPVEAPPMPTEMPASPAASLAQTAAAEIPTNNLTVRPAAALLASAPTGADSRANVRQGLSAEEQAAFEELRRRLEEGAEVVCVIRSRRNPEAQSEVLLLNSVSDAFVDRLAAMSRSPRGVDGSRGGLEPAPRQLTSLDLPGDAAPTAGSPPAQAWPPSPRPDGGATERVGNPGQPTPAGMAPIPTDQQPGPFRATPLPWRRGERGW